ncbi:high-affinity choline transporter 1-like isoform X2 [Dermacentor albipictus]|uniref:high-affinity choline transporter 1-like isoform X2 n=1 Tax=Dermacentor albipictus TaxID=60249 RepID=UPI0031FD08D5
MAVYLTALVAVIFYYIAVMCVGVWSGRKLHKNDGQRASTHESSRSHALHGRFVQKLFLADGRLSVFLGVFSMTATWVGGGYLNGTAEAVYTGGIVHCYAPIGYAFSLMLGGCLFAKKMRKANAITMLDPFQQHYGRWMGLLLCLPAVCGEVFWTAAMLAALGQTAGVIMEVNSAIFVVASASIILFYTALGGYYSVSYTDVFQISSTAAFLWICVPFAAKSHATNALRPPHNNWIGEVSLKDVVRLMDGFLVTALGGIPWQVYFQRVLGSESHYAARMFSYLAAIGCLFLALPPAILGAMAKTANFTAVGYPGPAILRDRDSLRVLPFSIRYLTTPAVSVLGMIGILAAVMSSVDSSMLSASAMVTWNVYHALIRPKASESEVALTLRLTVCVIGASATYLALSVQSVFDLWVLCSDVVYVLLFPQLVCVFYLKGTNAYGSVGAFVFGASSRWLIGEVSIGLAGYDSIRGHQIPFRLACMVLSMSTLILVSVITAVAFENRWLSLRYDVFHCFSDTRPTTEESVQSSERHRVDGTLSHTLRDRVGSVALAVRGISGGKRSRDASGSDEEIKLALDRRPEQRGKYSETDTNRKPEQSTKRDHTDKASFRKLSEAKGSTESARTSERTHASTRSTFNSARKSSVGNPRQK